MKEIILTQEQINNLPMLSKDSYGCYGKCYMYGNDVLKVFKRKITPYEYKNIEKNLKRESNIIMYPTQKMFLEDKTLSLKGYLCNKAPGTDLCSLGNFIANGKEDISFESFLSAYYDKFLPELKKESVILSDIKLIHIFFNECLYLIDTDWYEEKPNYMLEDQKNMANIKLLNAYLSNFIFKFISLDSCNDLFSKLCLENKASDNYIAKLLAEIKRVTSYEVSSLAELFKYTYKDDEKGKNAIII